MDTGVFGSAGAGGGDVKKGREISPHDFELKSWESMVCD